MAEPEDSNVPTMPIEEAAQDWFLRLASGDVTETDLAAFAAWRDADPRHRIAYDEVRDIWNDLGGLRTAFAHPGETAATDDTPSQGAAPASWRRAPTPRRAGVFRHPAFLGGLAAACLVLLVVSVAEITAWLRADHRTGVGEQAAVTLPDGSIAYLNTDTAISLAYSDDNRQVSLLHGEALFQVANDPTRPFVVFAVRGRTIATGTAFSVRDKGDSATVTVTDGAVVVSSPASDQRSRVTVNAGTQVSYAAGDAPGPVGHVDVVSATAWRGGSILIDGLPLAQAFAEVDRYVPGRILLLADTARLEPVTARLSIRTIDNALNALARTHGLSITRVTGYLTIVR